MAPKKTKFLNHSYQIWRHSSTKKLIRTFMRSFPKKGLCMGKLPPDEDSAITLLFFGLDLPDVLLNKSLASRNMRLDLVRLILTYPEFAVAAIYKVFVAKHFEFKKTSEVKTCDLVLQFLLTEHSVKLPNGKSVSQIGAKDGEIAMAIQQKYGIKDVPVKTVKNMRGKLEKICGSSCYDFVDFYVNITQGLDRLGLGGTPEEAREERRAEILSALRKAY